MDRRILLLGVVALVLAFTTRADSQLPAQKVVITSPGDVLLPIDVGVTPAGELKISCTGGNCGPTSASSLSVGTLAATTVAAALGAGAISQVLLQNDPDNVVDILCGSSTTQPVQLTPGDAMSLDVTNLNIVFCKTVSGTGTVNYVAR